MKKLGLIGGMGPQSTMPYYLNIVYGVQRRTSADFFPNITIESLNVFEILGMIGQGRLDDLTGHFLDAIGRLAAAGCEMAALTANTAHIVYDRLAAASPIPVVSMLDSVAAEVRRRGLGRVGLLGTSFTMEGDFYRLPFERQGIELVTPGDADRAYVDDKISTELEYGIKDPHTQHRLADIIAGMAAEHDIRAVILGCTELPMILDDSISPVPCLDTVAIHCADLVDRILEP